MLLENKYDQDIFFSLVLLFVFQAKTCHVCACSFSDSFVSCLMCSEGSEMNLKMTARMKVKPGTRLLMADESVGELYIIPVNPKICDINLLTSFIKIKCINIYRKVAS